MDQLYQNINALGATKDDKRLFHTLDALRGIAAFAVLFGHAPHHSIELQSSFLAVDLFFVLSGFVLAHAYEDRLIRGMRPITFMRIRWIRLFPLHFLGLLFGAVYSLVFLDVTSLPAIISMISAGLFFLPLPAHLPNDPDLLFILNVPAWSLFFEMAINLTYSLIAVRLGTRRLILLIAIGALAVVGAGVHFGTLNGGWGFPNITAGFARVLFSFFAGAGTYRLWKAQAFPRFALMPSLSAIGLIVALAMPQASFHLGVDLVEVLLVFPLLVLGAARREPPPVAWPLCRWLGVISYAVYVLQQSLLGFTMKLFDILVRPGFIERGFGALGLLSIIIVSATVIDRIYDRPVRSALSRILS